MVKGCKEWSKLLEAIKISFQIQPYYQPIFFNQFYFLLVTRVQTNFVECEEISNQFKTELLTSANDRAA